MLYCRVNCLIFFKFKFYLLLLFFSGDVLFAKVITGEEGMPVLEDIKEEGVKPEATGEDSSRQARAKVPQK